MIRLLVIATALLYGHALIVCGVPEDEVLRGAEQLSVGTEIDSVRFQDAVTGAMPPKNCSIGRWRLLFAEDSSALIPAVDGQGLRKRLNSRISQMAMTRKYKPSPTRNSVESRCTG